MELSSEKTKLSNSRTDRVPFLGVKFFKTHAIDLHKSSRGRPKRSPLVIRFEASFPKILSKLRSAGFCQGLRPKPKLALMCHTKDQIIHIHNAVLRGILNYYSFVHNYGRLAGLVSNIIKGACAMLLATKLGLKSQRAVYKKFGQNLRGPDKIAFHQVAYRIDPWRFNLKSKDIDIVTSLFTLSKSLASLNNLSCSACGSTYRVEMHHVRRLADLNPKARIIDRLMARANRKQIPLCRKCHMSRHKNSNSPIAKNSSPAPWDAKRPLLPSSKEYTAVGPYTQGKSVED